MPRFSTASKAKLATCHPDLQALFNEVIRHYDCKVICGHRGKEEQDEAVANGASKTPWPTSKHNSKPSLAVDVVPYFTPTPHIRWNDEDSAYLFVGFVKGIAVSLGINIRTGADWDDDKDTQDQTFNDLPHFELVNPTP